MASRHPQALTFPPILIMVIASRRTSCSGHSLPLLLLLLAAFLLPGRLARKVKVESFAPFLFLLLSSGLGLPMPLHQTPALERLEGRRGREVVLGFNLLLCRTIIDAETIAYTWRTCPSTQDVHPCSRFRVYACSLALLLLGSRLGFIFPYPLLVLLQVGMVRLVPSRQREITRDTLIAVDAA